jgi:peptide chain release factor 1
MNKKDLKISYYKGKGPGGQNKNKVETGCRIVHIPTGLKVEIDEQRTRKQNHRIALKRIEEKIKEQQDEQQAAEKKARRDDKIKNTPRIRTYDFKKGIVTNHTNGKTAPLKEVLEKGRIDLLH